MASWLVPSTLHRAVRVRALAGDIVLCSWARYFILSVPLSPPRFIDGYQRIKYLGGGGGFPCNGLASHPGGVEIILVASCYRNPT